MASSRSAHVRLTSALIHFLLCFVIIMQMLGTTTSLWTFQFETDLVEATLQEGFSLTANLMVPVSLFSTRHRVELSMRLRSVLLEETFFRPPHSRRSTMSLA